MCGCMEISSIKSISLLLSVLINGLTGKTLEEVVTMLGVKIEDSDKRLEEMVNLCHELNSKGVVKVINIVIAQPKLKHILIK